MYRLTRHWSAYAWTACLAVLLNAFAPIVSHALKVSAPLTVQTEVCTALGMELMPVAMAPDEPGTPASDKLKKGMEHCGYCAGHAGTVGPPSPLAPMLGLYQGRDLRPPLYYHSARPLFPWSLARSRAPPALA
jgi:hypothetical protein